MNTEKKSPLGRGLSSLFRHQEDALSHAETISDKKSDISKNKFDILEKEMDISDNELDISPINSDIYIEENQDPKKILTKSMKLPKEIQDRQDSWEKYRKIRTKLSPDVVKKYKENHLSQKSTFQHINIDFIKPGAFQPRTNFDPEELEELAQSIKENGILQPLLVRRRGDVLYELIAGERRWRAAKIAGLKQIPAMVVILTDDESYTAAIVENIQRENLNPLEEAKAYDNLIQKLNYTQQEISGLVGKSRSYVANMMRLLSLPEKILNYIQSEELTPGHARLLIGLEEVDAVKLADRMVKNKLNVRNAERLLKRSQTGEEVEEELNPPHAPYQDPEIQIIQNQIRETLGLEVFLKNQGNQGTLILKFMNLNQLDDIIERLTRKNPEGSL